MIFKISHHWLNLLHQNIQSTKQFIGTFAKKYENIIEGSFLWKITLYHYFYYPWSPQQHSNQHQTMEYTLKELFSAKKNNCCKFSWIIKIRFRKWHRGDKIIFFLEHHFLKLEQYTYHKCSFPKSYISDLEMVWI